MLDDKLLEAFMNGFYGYGTWKAKYWFVGLEEGGGRTCEEISDRLRAWDQRGRPEIDDIRGFHREAGLKDWFGTVAQSQSTWEALICAVLAAEKRPVASTSILEFQKRELGASDGETAVIESLPLPSPGKKIWNYKRWSSLPVLSSRAAYRRAYLKGRSGRIAELIRLNIPRVVVFYGDGQTWNDRFHLSALGSHPNYAGCWGETLLIITDHPGAWSNDGIERFTAIGEYIGEELRRNLHETS